MLRAEPSHIVMEILASEMGSLPIPKTRRNTSLKNLETQNVLPKLRHGGNTTETCCRHVAVMTKLWQCFVSFMFPSWCNFVNPLSRLCFHHVSVMSPSGNN